MKYILTLVLVLAIQTVFAQNSMIDVNNYYDFLDKTNDRPVTTNWLRRTEIVPIIKEELERYGFKYNNEYQLYQVESNQFIILEMYNREYNFGFLYKTGHYAQPEKSHRSKKYSCQVPYYDVSGQFGRLVIDSLPINIYLLNEDCYWYKYEKDKYEDNNYVNRSVIINILRSDIRKILANYKNLEEALEETKWKEVEPNPEFSGFIFVDSWAKFIDGRKGLDQYIVENLRYPEKVRRKKIEEEIILEYEVKADGTIGEIIVFEGVNKLLIDEAKRVIRNMPLWKPALQRGEKISVSYVQKLEFKL